MPVQSTEEEESRRTKRESAASLYKARTTGGGERKRGGLYEEAGVRKGRMKLEEATERREREKCGTEKRMGRAREREGERGRERERESTSTRLGGYVRIIILRYSHIYKSAI